MVSRIERTRGHVFSLLLSSATFPFFFIVFATLRVTWGVARRILEKKTGSLESEKQ